MSTYVTAKNFKQSFNSDTTIKTWNSAIGEVQNLGKLWVLKQELRTTGGNCLKYLWLAYRENCVLVNDEDANHCESNRFSTKSAEKHVYLQRSINTYLVRRWLHPCCLMPRCASLTSLRSSNKCDLVVQVGGTWWCMKSVAGWCQTHAFSRFFQNKKLSYR